MFRIRIWLILLSVGLIILDKYSFVSTIRDYTAVYMQKQISLLFYRMRSYPHLVLLQKTEQRQLERENIHLKQQIEEYSLQMNQQQNRQENTKELQELRDQASMTTNFKTTVARAIIDVNYLVNNRLLLDKGSADGLVLGDAVVNKIGVIGQISVVNPHNAQVTLISNPDYKIYLQNSITKSKMLAQGIGNSSLSVKYISKVNPLKIGDLLVTTGLDDIYPANLSVARITKIFYENNGFNSALCQPVVNLNKLQFVLVLKNAH